MRPAAGSVVESAASASLLDRAQALRDRLLTSARFRRWAAAFPLTRPIARRRTRALFDLCAGFVYSQILLACVRLRLFDILAEGPQTAAALAPRLSLSLDDTLRLLKAAVSLRLVADRGRDRFGLGALGAAMVDNPAVAAMVEHHPMLYDDLRDPVALLRGRHRDTELARYWPYAGPRCQAPLTAAQVDAYTRLMAASQPLVADQILDAYPLKKHRCLLDVGGGDGSFVAAVAARTPALSLMMVDLPAVAEQARARFERSGLAARVTAVGADFLADPLPTGADVISLVRVVHDHDDAAVLRLLRAAREALPVGGVLLIAEPMSGTAGALPIGDAYFAFYLLAMGRGRPRTVDELERLIRAAGFDRVHEIATSTPLLARLVVARATHVCKSRLTL